MKRCPNCGALSFSDLDMCYECLYRFDGEEDGSIAEDVAGCSMAAARKEDVLASGSFCATKKSAPNGALEVVLTFDRLPECGCTLAT